MVTGLWFFISAISRLSLKIVFTEANFAESENELFKRCVNNVYFFIIIISFYYISWYLDLNYGSINV